MKNSANTDIFGHFVILVGPYRFIGGCEEGKKDCRNGITCGSEYKCDSSSTWFGINYKCTFKDCKEKADAESYFAFAFRFEADTNFGWCNLCNKDDFDKRQNTTWKWGLHQRVNSQGMNKYQAKSNISKMISINLIY